MTNIDCLLCFNCGYLQLINGTKIPLKEEYGDIPFCDDFTSSQENTKLAKLVRCTIKPLTIICRMEKMFHSFEIGQYGT